ncbi:MAG: hypothetical protein EOO73_21670 [Myxococcales bacterium]|nr:MAG: hypothetical protein EOO73_21670 [Myxococcales bacterium]
MRRRSLLVVVLGAVSVLASSGLASASPAAKRPSRLTAPQAPVETVIEVSVLHGSHEKRAPDPRTADMPELREGPFARYESYQLLSRTSLSLARGTKRQLKLPDGRLLEARLDALLPDGSSRLVASINRPQAKDFLPLLEVKARPGQSFIVAGQSYRRGVLVLVFKVLR